MILLLTFRTTLLMTLPYEPESYRPAAEQPTDDEPTDSEAPAPTGERVPRFAIFAACPKCGGQYERDGYSCACFQCSFEWDMLDAIEDVLNRAFRRYPGPPPAPRLHDTPRDLFGEEPAA